MSVCVCLCVCLRVYLWCFLLLTLSLCLPLSLISLVENSPLKGDPAAESPIVEAEIEEFQKRYDVDKNKVSS